MTVALNFRRLVGTGQVRTETNTGRAGGRADGRTVGKWDQVVRVRIKGEEGSTNKDLRRDNYSKESWWINSSNR